MRSTPAKALALAMLLGGLMLAPACGRDRDNGISTRPVDRGNPTAGAGAGATTTTMPRTPPDVPGTPGGIPRQ